MRINGQIAAVYLASLLAALAGDVASIAQPPENQLKLSAAAAGRRVHLRWTGDVDADVVAIEILRGKGVDGDLQLLKEITDLDAAFYTDDDVKVNTDYRYALRLRDQDQILSAAGEPLSLHSGRYVRRINCGGEIFFGADGIPWEADTGRVLGTGRFTSKNVLADVYPEVRLLYRSERWAYQRLQYDFELTPGRYALVLCFAETNPNYMGSGKRTFDIFVGGNKVQEAFDVFSQVGANKPLHLTIHADVSETPFTVELQTDISQMG